LLLLPQAVESDSLPLFALWRWLESLLWLT
jgi:hypothetical protein